ncbi:MAG: DUF1127 domain-containing protein [Sediminimonas sp.]|uniref:DUF1127 domain-containing protein n=1 Tax=Sediminimonas sp. TaxID=2823379 RepID=UPI0028703290|nr:DUF1127 domain-containing protein [Sediminimonas sp.]MDR9486300.1 DUF1127 domain-containing protein [Sediminimonas sp.]
MAHVTHIPTAAHHGLFDRAAQVLKGLGERYARYRIYRETLNELASLSNRELSDIGMSRSQIRSVAYEHAYGPRA